MIFHLVHLCKFHPYKPTRNTLRGHRGMGSSRSTRSWRTNVQGEGAYGTAFKPIGALNALKAHGCAWILRDLIGQV